MKNHSLQVNHHFPGVLNHHFFTTKLWSRLRRLRLHLAIRIKEPADGRTQLPGCEVSPFGPLGHGFSDHGQKGSQRRQRPICPEKTVRMLVSWDAVFGGVSWCFPIKIPKKCPEDSLKISLKTTVLIHVFLRTPKRVLKFLVVIPEPHPGGKHVSTLLGAAMCPLMAKVRAEVLMNQLPNSPWLVACSTHFTGYGFSFSIL